MPQGYSREVSKLHRCTQHVWLPKYKLKLTLLLTTAVEHVMNLLNDFFIIAFVGLVLQNGLLGRSTANGQL